MKKQDYILALTHSTKCVNIPSILNSGYVKSRLELYESSTKYEGSNDNKVANYHAEVDDIEFPGVYLGILTADDIGKKWDGSIGNLSINIVDNNVITLVFSTVLLRQDNWHANLEDNMGYITNKTFSKPSLEKFINCIHKEKKKISNMNNILSTEVVFHDKVGLGALQEIWVRDSKYIDILKKKIPKKFHSMIKKVCVVPNTVYNKFTSLPKFTLSSIIDTKSKPNFCFWVGNYSDKKKFTQKYIKEIASNCGIKANDINNYLKEDALYDELFTLAGIYRKNRLDSKYFPNSNWIIEIE